MIKYLKTRWKIGVLALLMVAVTAGILFLYDIPLEPVGYVAVFEMLLTGLGLMWDYHKYRKKQESLLYIRDCGNFSEEYLEAPENENEAIYREICRSMDEKRIEAENQRSAFGTELTDFYTLWVHQIKTPIAAARLLLQEEKPRPQEIQNELFKVEQYVEMVLSYLRLDSDSTDYVLREYPLDDILRQAVRKFAKMFILKKITLDFQETGKTVLTDEKWLLFVVEQVLSNALKYTPEGGTIRIYGDGATVVIADNGIGIREEDQARVFEKGFTGYNGRADKKSTGIGLYLCRQVMDRLNHGISLTSRPGQGTLVRLDLSREWRMIE